MPTAGPEVITNHPPHLPPVTGLLQAADIVEHDDDHWLAGIRWAPANNVALTAVDPCVYTTNLPATASHPGPVAYYPFAVVEEDTCSPWSFREEDFRAYAIEGLLAKEWGAVEAEFERGTLFPANPHLADTVANSPNLTFVTGTNQATSLALSPSDAMAALDEAIAKGGLGLGMIHATAFVISKWTALGLLTRAYPETDSTGLDIEHTPLFSPKGNVVVAGNGYLGAGPDGTVPASHANQWAYATSLVTVHRDRNVSFTPDSTAQALNRTTNTITWRAWRVYAFAWSRGLHAAALVDTRLVAAP